MAILLLLGAALLVCGVAYKWAWWWVLRRRQQAIDREIAEQAERLRSLRSLVAAEKFAARRRREVH